MMKLNRTKYSPELSKKKGKGTGDLGTDATKVKSSGSKSDYVATAGMGDTNVSQLPIEVDVDPLLKDIVFSEDLEQKKLITRLYRDIYYNDPIGGSSVDLMSSLPFSDITIGGVSDDKASQAFNETMERLNCKTLCPHLTVDHLVDGAFIGSLLFNKSTKKFFDIMPHRLDNCKIDSLPMFGQDPIITAAIPEETRTLFGGDSKRIQSLRERLGEDVMSLLSQDALELDPLSTIYIPRKPFTTSEGVSWFRRILPIYLIEKNLFRGTLIESARRQRGILHVSLGDGEEWEPTVADMEFMTELFMNADSDPLGAVIATRLGVATEEIRQGGDFWKVTDIWDSTAQFKLRALGISESFLSGDANYACIVGRSLIPTSEGLLRIDQMVGAEHLPADESESKKDIYVPVSHLVQSRYANERAAKWKYSGYTDTLKVTTELGNDLVCTDSHPFLVLNERGDTSWIKAEKLTVGDNVCVPTKGLVRTTKLDLYLTQPADDNGKRKYIKQPTQMTPRLAYLLGALVAEGWMTEDKKVSFSTSDPQFLDRISKFYDKVFGLETLTTLRVKAGDTYTILGKEGTANVDCYELIVGSRTLVAWIKELGFVYGRGENNELPSTNQEIPWSVLQADVESQYAFLAAFAEGDATVNANVAFASNSVRLLEQIQSMLFSHGIMSHRREGFTELGYTDSRDFWERTERYRCTKSLELPENRAVKPRSKLGFPIKFLKDFVESRKIGQIGKATGFINDAGIQIVLEKCRENMYSLNGANFMYDKFEDGGYDGYLSRLRLISESMFNKVMNLVQLRYMVVPVTSIEQNGKEHVYDISMSKGVEPAFVANGIIVHNTADTSLTVFIEFIRSFRDNLTQKLFYNKIFPLVSLVNGFTVNAKGKLIRKDSLLESDDIEGNLDKLANGTKLLIPSVHWSKQLKPEGDASYMDMLQTMSDQGIPVPLRAIAAAGGFNLDSMLADSEDDIAMMRRIGEYKKQKDEINSEFGSGSEEEGAFASTSSVLARNGGKHVGLANRDFGKVEEVTATTKTGKKQYVPNQKNANERINRNIAKALTDVTTNTKTSLTHTTVTPKEKK
jgi:intein/homing endonuclease